MIYLAIRATTSSKADAYNIVSFSLMAVRMALNEIGSAIIPHHHFRAFQLRSLAKKLTNVVCIRFGGRSSTNSQINHPVADQIPFVSGTAYSTEQKGIITN